MHLDRFARPAGIQVIPLLNLLFQDTSHTGKLIDDLFIVDELTFCFGVILEISFYRTV